MGKYWIPSIWLERIAMTGLVFVVMASLIGATLAVLDGQARTSAELTEYIEVCIGGQVMTSGTTQAFEVTCELVSP
jgi:hypothetical protein